MEDLENWPCFRAKFSFLNAQKDYESSLVTNKEMGAVKMFIIIIYFKLILLNINLLLNYVFKIYHIIPNVYYIRISNQIY